MTAGAIAIDERTIQREGLAGRSQADVGSEFGHRSHHSFSLVSSAVGRPSATQSFFWASIISLARSSSRRKRALSRLSCWICRTSSFGFGPRFFGASANFSALPTCLRQLASIEEYRRSRRKNAPSCPLALQRSASANRRRFSLPENRRRRAIGSTSGSGGESRDDVSTVALRAPSETSSRDESD